MMNLTKPIIMQSLIITKCFVLFLSNIIFIFIYIYIIDGGYFWFEATSPSQTRAYYCLPIANHLLGISV